jgi:selenocysteine-specific elongation factor
MSTDLILAIAGPAGHGKTALIRALCGAAGDRLPDEKRRGGTIDLNFASLDLDDLHIGVIDLPGDPRYLKNMLAGATGADVVLFVTAADCLDESAGREQLDTFDLLGVRHGVIALSRCDLVSAAATDRAEAAIRVLDRDTFLSSAAVVRTSAQTGYGISELKAALVAACRRVGSPPDAGLFRLPIDRAFTIADGGIVVTGSILSGSVRAGEELELQPGGRRVRVRSIQNHNRTIAEGRRGQRAALALDGVGIADVWRGQELAAPGYLIESVGLTARLRCREGSRRPPPHHAPIQLHLGTATAAGHVTLLDGPRIDPGNFGLARVLLAEPVATVWGQRFIVRDPGTGEVWGGGRVIEPVARKVRRRDLKAVERRESLESEDLAVRAVTVAWLAGPVGVTLVDLVRGGGIPAERAEQLLRHLEERGDLIACGEVSGVTPRFVHADVAHAVEDRVLGKLAAWSRESGDGEAAEREAVLAQFADLGKDALIEAILLRLCRQGRLIRNGELFAWSAVASGHDPSAVR